jgi:hypothetical protein
MRAFAEALDAVPMALAENSGLSPIETLANIKSRQAKENNSRLGVDCMQTGSNGKCPVLLFLFCPSFPHMGLWSSPPARFATSNTNSTTWLVAFYSLFLLHRRCIWFTLRHPFIMHSPVAHARLYAFRQQLSRGMSFCPPPRNISASHLSCF